MARSSSSTSKKNVIKSRVLHADNPQSTDQIFSRLIVTDSEMIPSWIPTSSLSRRRSAVTRSDSAKLHSRSHSLPSSSHIHAFATPPSPLGPTQSRNPTTMQSVPESRQQTFEEIYGPPENFLEIEVSRHPAISFSLGGTTQLPRDSYPPTPRATS